MKIYSLIFFLFFSISSKDYKVLVLPGGGATAIMNAIFLKYIEVQTGKKIVKLFDEIWTCSAGSIIAGLITLPNGKSKTIDEVIHFFKNTFLKFYQAYYIRERFSSIVGSTLLKDTIIPVRILVGAAYSLKEKWYKYGLTNNFENILLSDAVSASCTVYPYLFRSAYRINFNQTKPSYFIDAGSFCCDFATTDPTSYFLEQFIKQLDNCDTLTVYFLPNLFTQSLDYNEVFKVLNLNKNFSWEMRYDDDSYHANQKRAQIEIINISSNVDCIKLIRDFLKSSDYLNKLKIIIVKLILEKIMGKENAAANLLASGFIPLSVLELEADKVIKFSKSLEALIQNFK